MESTPSYEQVQEIRQALRDIGIAHWYGDDLFSWQWWILLAASILPWVLWFRFFLPRMDPFKVICYGFVMGIVATLFDVIGADLMLWAYPTKLIPMVPPLFPADLTVVPVSFMIIYSRFNQWKGYIFASLICSAFFAYIVEPLFILVDMFSMNRSWSHNHSFIGLILLAVFCKWLNELITKRIRNLMLLSE